MHRIIVLLSGLGLWLLMAPAFATTILQCEDDEGNTSFQEQRCPPGSQAVVTKKIRTESQRAAATLKKLQQDKPVVLFRVNDCEACDQVSGYLRCQDVPFTEKNVSNDSAAQEELLHRTGELSVPVVTIGDEVVNGYSKETLTRYLDAAGYPGDTEAETASVQAVSHRP